MAAEGVVIPDIIAFGNLECCIMSKEVIGGYVSNSRGLESAVFFFRVESWRMITRSLGCVEDRRDARYMVEK